MMCRKIYRPVALLFFGAAAFVCTLPAQAQTPPSATITYDGAGRTVTTLYTDQTCVVHKYNAQGNRTDTTVTKADVPETSVWGTGSWGCSKWAPP